MRYIFTLLAVIFLFPGNTGFAQQVADLITDRPDETESASNVPVRSLQIETGFIHEWVSTEKTDEEYNNIFNTTVLRYGLLSNFEFRIGTDYLSNVSNVIKSPVGDDYIKTSGINPLMIGAKIHVTEEKGLLPFIAFLESINIPGTGKAEFNPDGIAHEFRRFYQLWPELEDPKLSS